MFACSSKCLRRSGSRGFVLPTAAVLFIVSIPIVGLVIDVGTFYMIQSRLQAAVDAAALAGARSLARGDNSGAQQIAAQDTAVAYFDANFPSGYMLSTDTNRTAVADITQAFYRTVTVTGSTNAPHLFMRWFGGTFTNVNARAVATRRDVNVMLVMDRSSSLQVSGSCQPLKNAALGFIDKFSEGRDNVGLVTFATSSIVARAPSQTFKSAMTSTINSMACAGYTNSASGIWMGYQQLATLDQPAALNVILFFTDGEPTATTTTVQIKSSSTCTDKNAKTGAIAFSPPTTSSPTGFIGILRHDAIASSSDQTLISTTTAFPHNNSSNCYFAGSSTGRAVGNDITGIPTTDYFGNDLQFSYLTPVNAPSSLLAATDSSTNAGNYRRATYNAAVSAAVRARSGSASPGNGYSALSDVVIFSIGLGGSGAASDDFMEYVANDPSNTNHFDNSRRPGLYVYANSASDLADAFNRIASEILRLAQ